MERWFWRKVVAKARLIGGKGGVGVSEGMMPWRWA